VALLVFELDRRTDPDLAGRKLRLFDQDRVVKAVAQRSDTHFQEALFVLRGVVFEVLRQVAVLTRRFDRLNDGCALRAFELGKLRGERVALTRGETVDSRLVHALTA
jgi:hypothetical protein